MPVNALPDDPITVLRLLSELEGVSNFVSIFDDEDEIAYLDAMKKKYYKKYFRMMKQEKAKQDETEDNSSQKMQK
ncbi:MAG: hypothetical protein HRT70_04475 [Flavobacteriaceae bacterium]|nr:hypothetical protein [Flavobacteriaceae bacterium]